MEKKRIFITAHYLEIGGAETSLIGLLGAIDYSKYEVDLFLQAVQGEMLQYVPKEVNVLPEIGCYSMIEKPLSECIKKGYWRVAMARLIAKLKFRQYAKKHHPKDSHSYYDILDNEITKVLPTLYQLGEYDLAISYIAMKTVVLDKVKAKKKICWIHTDYSTVDCYKPLALPLWNRFDNIISISPDVTKAFLKYLPETAPKIVECENILPKGLILSKAEMKGDGKFFESQALSKRPEAEREEFKKFEGLKLLSVGRICEAKNYDNIPYMAAKLKELLNSLTPHLSHLTFTWFIVGPGDHTTIDALSEKLGVKDNVVFLGPSSNPYPFLKNCDIYVHPSRYEGKSIVVREAQVLCKPIVITNYPTAHSQVNDGVDGVIVPLDNEGCAKGLAEFILDVDKQQQIIKNLQNEDHAGESEVNKIYKFID